MPLPWLGVLDAVIGVIDIVRSRRIGKLREQSDARQPDTKGAAGAMGGLETRLAGEVAALKEAFERDTRRLDLEREQIEAERLRAERAMRIELLRQAGDREIGRLRLIAGIAVAAWIGTLFFVARLASAAVGARFTFGVGWMLLLGAIAASFSAQASVARELARAVESDGRDTVSSGTAGTAAMWLLVGALALVGLVALSA